MAGDSGALPGGRVRGCRIGFLRGGRQAAAHRVSAQFGEWAVPAGARWAPRPLSCRSILPHLEPHRTRTADSAETRVTLTDVHGFSVM